MDAVIIPSRTVLRLSNFVSFGRKPIFALKEIADAHPLLNSRSGIRLSVSSIRADRNGEDPPPRRSSVPARTRKNGSSRKTKSGGNKASDDQNPKSSNQEEIIALFRKIQTSIANEKSSSTKGEDSQKVKSGAESILEVLRESRKQTKGKTSKKSGDKVLSGKEVHNEQEMDHTLPAADFKLVRPLSKFVKRSPIPSPSTPRVNVPQREGEASVAMAVSKKFPNIEDMKVSELKAAAKSRGIKGYSKLKKDELLELLRS